MEKTMYGILKTTGICPIMVAPDVDFAADAAKGEHPLPRGKDPHGVHRGEQKLPLPGAPGFLPDL